MSASTRSHSTTNSPTFTTPGSNASNPRVPKRRRELQGGKTSQKRRKVIGRPKNDWTPSRRRKLVRLYLMTNLEPKEIAKVLQDGSFNPCIRDIQDQLSALLQARPNLIRSKGHITKQRLRQLRECRKAQTLRATKKPLHKEGLRVRGDEDNGTAATEMDEGWIDEYDASRISNLGLVSEDPWGGECDVLGAVDSPITSPMRPNRSLDLSPTTTSKIQEEEAIHSWDSLSSTNSTAYGWPLSAIELPRVLPERRSFVPDTPSSASRESESFKSNSALQSRITLAPNAVEKSIPKFQNGLLDDLASYRKPRAPPYVTPKIANLKKRLSYSTEKYSPSALEDIVSLMEHFTITTSSASSIGRSEWGRMSKATFSTDFLIEEENAQSQSKLEYPIELPGNFPKCCWKQIMNNELMPCIKGQDYRGVVICRHMGRKAHSIQYTAFLNPQSEKVDIFGNSTLHIAAALASPLDLLISLVQSELSVHVLNSADQTFLHLIRPECLNMCLADCVNLCTDDCPELCMLLTDLNVRKFNFLQLDHHGRAPLHWLTGSEISPLVARKVFQTMVLLDIPCPLWRDNIGCSIIEQARLMGNFNIESELLDAPNFPKTKSSAAGDYCRNFLGSNCIQTVGDLQRYAYQADLLTTINKSLESPLFEDSSGRNGLHCLAEVSFNSPAPGPELPTQSSDDPPESVDTNHSTMMLRSLETLLAAGVDPNNYDKNGLTPLMSFIVHTTPSEDDDLTHKLLLRLHKAGADINRRNRQGETCLHLAVKLGRRVATKFLLRLQANVHVRNSNGLGVVALGHRCARNAKNNEVLYAQIMLCVSLAVNAGAVSSPTIIGEWGMCSWMVLPVGKLMHFGL